MACVCQNVRRVFDVIANAFATLTPNSKAGFPLIVGLKSKPFNAS